MRSVWVVAILLIQILSPFAVAETNKSTVTSRSVEVDLIGLDSEVIHRDELIEVFFTLHNTGTTDTNYAVQLMTPLEGITESGLPLSVYLEAGYLKQVKFNLTADISANFGIQTATLNVTSVTEPSWSLEHNFSVKVAPYSDLKFGPSGVSSFIVTPGIRTSVAVNLTNQASLTDNVTFNLYSQTGWTWGWDMDDVDGVNAFQTIAIDELTYVYLWIEVPEIRDGMPLEYTGPRFQLKAVSSIDEAIVQWSFDLLVTTYRNASIDQFGEDLLLEPGGNGRIPVTVRNNGNSLNSLNITLEALDSNGMPLEGFSPSDRIAANGWTMALFGGLEEIQLQPNESRVIEIGFQSPLEYSGSIDVRVRVFADGALVRLQTIDLNSRIEWVRSVEASRITETCQNLLPNTSCTSSITIQNTGNAADEFEFSIQSSPMHLTATLLTSSVELSVQETTNLEILHVTAQSDARAFVNGDVVVGVYLKESSVAVIELRIPVNIAPVVQWEFSDLVEEIDTQGRLSIAMTLRNRGNTDDGLLVQMQSSHSTDMSFIPPTIAVFEDGVEYPRSFEISNISIGANFTLRAWVDLPQDQIANGTLWLNITVRSQFEPDKEFISTSTADYLGTPWQTEEQPDGLDVQAFLVTGWELFKAWGLMLLAIAVSVAIITASVKARKQRSLEQRELEEMRRPVEPEEVGDWMEKFQQKAPQVIEEPRLKVSTEEFQQAFQSRAGAYKTATQPVDTRLTQAAITVLDHHDKSELKSTADSLLTSIQDQGISKPAPENQVLHAEDTSTQRTIRSDEQPIASTAPTQQVSVPLPIDLDDFDV